MSVSNFLKRNLLFISVFITGAIVLIVEILAVRILSPYYGSTIFTVSGVISVILAALSIGYYAGGKLADRNPSSKQFFGLILSGGIALLGLNLLGIMILPILGLIFSLISGPLIASLILFFPPAFILGTLSPYAIKLQNTITPEQGVGTVAGKVFFWSTLGSITGSLLAGFVLIPRFGVNETIIASGIILFLLGFVPVVVLERGRNLIGILLLATIFASGAIFGSRLTEKNVIYANDGLYEKIKVYDGVLKNRPTRFLLLNRNASSAMFLDSDNPADLAYDYSKYYLLYRIFKPDTKNILVMGGGAYSVPRVFLAELPAAQIDVVEIEPTLYRLAKEKFNLKENPRLKNYITDGRRFLKSTDKKYDLIFGDAFSSFLSVPPHLTTEEFFKTARKRLAKNGIMIINFVGDLEARKKSLTFSEIKTFKKVFPNSYFFAVNSPKSLAAQNLIFVGYNSNKIINFNPGSLERFSDPFISSLPEKLIDLAQIDLSPYQVLTDNFAPVEYLSIDIIKKAFQRN